MLSPLKTVRSGKYPMKRATLRKKLKLVQNVATRK